MKIDSIDALESVATTTELSALVYLRYVEFNTSSASGTGVGIDSRYIDMTLDEQGDVVFDNVVHTIALAFDAKDAHDVFTVTRGCEDNVGSGHDAEIGITDMKSIKVCDRLCHGATITRTISVPSRTSSAFRRARLFLCELTEFSYNASHITQQDVHDTRIFGSYNVVMRLRPVFLKFNC